MNSKNIIIIDENDRISIPGFSGGQAGVALVDGDVVHIAESGGAFDTDEISSLLVKYDGSGSIEIEEDEDGLGGWYLRVDSYTADDMIEHMFTDSWDGFWEWCRDTADEVAEQLTTEDGREDIIREVMYSIEQGLLLFSEEHMREAVAAWIGDGSDLLDQREEAA